MEAKKNYGYDAIGRLSISSFNCLFWEVKYFWNFTLAMSVIVLALSISFLWSIFTFRNLRNIKVEVFFWKKEMFTHKVEICVAQNEYITHKIEKFVAQKKYLTHKLRGGTCVGACALGSA